MQADQHWPALRCIKNVCTVKARRLQKLFNLPKKFPSSQLGNNVRLAVTWFGPSGPTDCTFLGNNKTGLLSKCLDELLRPLVVTGKLNCFIRLSFYGESSSLALPPDTNQGVQTQLSDETPLL